jgi:hypothetical protein
VCLGRRLGRAMRWAAETAVRAQAHSAESRRGAAVNAPARLHAAPPKPTSHSHLQQCFVRGRRASCYARALGSTESARVTVCGPRRTCKSSVRLAAATATARWMNRRATSKPTSALHLCAQGENSSPRHAPQTLAAHAQWHARPGGGPQGTLERSGEGPV